MQFADLRLPVSTRLQLNFIGLDYKRHPCDGLLLGFRPGESVLVYLPNKPPQVLLREETKVEVKSALQAGIIKFETAIDTICEQPYPYLHLRYPNDVTLEPLRRYPRFPLETKLSLSALTAMGITTARLRGRFCDISLQGARLAVEKELTGAVNKVMLVAPVTVAGMQHSLEVSGELKRAFGRDEKRADFPFVYGVSFIDLSPAQRLLLLALCHELQGHAAYGEA